MMNMKRVVLIFALMVAVLPLAAQNGGSILGKYKKALIIGAHPDDPEYCCGGTALMLQRTGCEVVNVYLTGGEAGIPGKSGEKCQRRCRGGNSAFAAPSSPHGSRGRTNGQVVAKRRR